MPCRKNSPARLEIRPALAEDLDEICRIEKESTASPWKYSYFFSETVNPLAHFWVAEDINCRELTGFILFWRIEDEIELHKIAVSRIKRQRGSGSALLKAMIDFAESEKVQRIDLEVRSSNNSALKMYKKFGFSQTGFRRDYYSNPIEDALVMTRLCGLSVQSGSR